MRVQSLSILFCAFLFASMNSAQSSEDHEYALLTSMPPPYPRAAYDRGLEAIVTIEFNINEQGRAQNTRVIQGDRDGIFQESSIEAAENYRFRPRVIDGEPITVAGVQYKLTYCLENPSNNGGIKECREKSR